MSSAPEMSLPTMFNVVSCSARAAFVGPKNEGIVVQLRNDVPLWSLGGCLQEEQHAGAALVLLAALETPFARLCENVDALRSGRLEGLAATVAREVADGSVRWPVVASTAAPVITSYMVLFSEPGHDRHWVVFHVRNGRFVALSDSMEVRDRYHRQGEPFLFAGERRCTYGLCLVRYAGQR